MSQKPRNINGVVVYDQRSKGKVEIRNVSPKATPQQIKDFLILYAAVCPNAFQWETTNYDPRCFVREDDQSPSPAETPKPEPKLGVGDQIKQKIEKLNEANNNSAILARAKKALQEKKANEPLPQPKAVEEIPAKPAPSSPVLVQPPKPDTLIYRIILYIRDNPDATHSDITRAMSDGPNGHWDQVRNTMASFMHFFAVRVEDVGGRHIYRYSLIPELLAAVTPAQQPEEPKPVERKPTSLFKVKVSAPGTMQRTILNVIQVNPKIGSARISEILNQPRGHISAHLRNLLVRGLVTRTAETLPNKVTGYLYSLTPATEKALKADQGW